MKIISGISFGNSDNLFGHQVRQVGVLRGLRFPLTPRAHEHEHSCK